MLFSALLSPPLAATFMTSFLPFTLKNSVIHSTAARIESWMKLSHGHGMIWNIILSDM
jgi:hypothetical protein